MSQTVLKERACVSYKNLSEKYAKSTDFTKQYCSIYNVRIEHMRTILTDKIGEKWGDDYPISRLHEIAENNYPKCIIIGTLFKDQKLKPSVLKQLAENNKLIPQPVHTHFTDEGDVLYIEDELQRYQLLGVLTPALLVTGITCALLGSDLGKGKFMVEDYCFCGFRTQIERPQFAQDSFVVLVSGLDLINAHKNLIPMQLLCNWVAGLIGDLNNVSAQVVRVIIAGNSIRTEVNKTKQITSMTSRSVEAPETIDAVKTLDAFLWELCQVVTVDVMPGEFDPSNHVLPQQNMHHCMFPNSSLYKSMNHVTNPYECNLGGVLIMGNSGQPVTDILRFSDIKQPIDVMEACLQWNHMAPTAPDTLGCFPHYESDPFIIEQCPHVFFTGNQDQFDTKLVTGGNGQEVRLICVPEFSSTQTVCVLNLRDFNCFPIRFDS